MIKTERLSLRTIENDDWPLFKEIWEQFMLGPYRYFDGPFDTEESHVKELIKKWHDASAKSSDHMYFICLLENCPIGFFSLHKEGEGYEIGYGFLEQYQKKGYAKEALLAISKHLRKMGASFIHAGTALENIPSIRLLESTGFQFSGTEILSFYKDPQGNPIYFEGGIFMKRIYE